MRRNTPSDERGAIPVLTISASDDLPDILENIRRTATSRILLDCRQHPVLCADPFVRRLLQATAADFGKDVAFQLTDPAGSAAASSARREARARPVVSGPRRKRLLPRMLPDRPRLPWRRLTLVTPHGRGALIAFAVVAGMLLTGVVMFVAPRARARVVLATEPFSADLTLWLDTSVQEPQLATSTHPVRFLRSEEPFEGVFPVETVVEKGARAEGVVDIVNDTAAPQGIKARTRLQSTSGVVVRTQRDVIVPAGGRASVAVRAEEGGSTANLEPQRLVLPALSTASQRVLSGELVRPLRGGTDRSVRQLAATDIERGTAILREQAEGKLLELVRSDARAASASEPEQKREAFSRPELSRVAVGTAESDPPAGTETDSFRLRTTIRAEALGVDVAALRAFLLDVLRRRVGDAKDLSKESSLEDLRVVDVRWDRGRVELSLHVETPLIPRLDREELRARLQGRTAEDAAAFLRALPGVRSADVRLSPPWVKRVPSLRRNIHLDTTAEP